MTVKQLCPARHHHAETIQRCCTQDVKYEQFLAVSAMTALTQHKAHCLNTSLIEVQCYVKQQPFDNLCWLPTCLLHLIATPFILCQIWQADCLRDAEEVL